MTQSILRAIALTSALALLSSHVAAQSESTTATPTSADASTASSASGAKAITTLGCYSKPDPLTSQGDYTFQSSGYCQGVCVGLNMPVMAITGGSTCYCGSEFPALDLEVSPSNCDSPCDGFGSQFCGGIGFWQIYLTGLTGDVETAPNSTTSTTPSSTGTGTGSSTSSQAAVVTKPNETIVVTQSSTASPDQNKSSSGGSNKVAIAVGVVVGIIGVAAIIGGTLLFLRHKRNREIEEEHRRNAAVSSFVGSTKSDKSSTDQRLDPSIYTHRRQSIGSIADERDFSRRILQVTTAMQCQRLVERSGGIDAREKFTFASLGYHLKPYKVPTLPRGNDQIFAPLISFWEPEIYVHGLPTETKISYLEG